MPPDLSRNLFVIISAIGIAQACFWAFTLLSIKGANHRSNYWLSALLLSLAMGMTYEVFYQNRLLLDMPHLIEITAPLKFLYPPLIYLYVTSLCDPAFNLREVRLHFVPAAISVIVLLPFFTGDIESKKVFIERSYVGLSPTYLVFSASVVLYEIIYIVILWRKLNALSAQAKRTYSSIDQVDLRWIRQLVIAFILLTPIYMLFFLFKWEQVSPLFSASAFTAFVFVMGFKGLRQPEIFLLSSKENKYQKSGLTEAKAREQLDHILNFMEKERPYTESDLTLPQLADRLDISVNHLSQILNGQLRQNFFDFINSYRVEAAKKALANPSNKHLTILAIAYDVGFASKSSFNTAFKRHTKMTPSQFMKISKFETAE